MKPTPEPVKLADATMQEAASAIMAAALAAASIAGWRLVRLCAIVLAASYLVSASPWGRGDSDQQEWFSPRSGLKVSTDELTGCQYFVGPSGGVIRRVDGKGRHVCTR